MLAWLLSLLGLNSYISYRPWPTVEDLASDPVAEQNDAAGGQCTEQPCEEEGSSEEDEATDSQSILGAKAHYLFTPIKDISQGIIMPYIEPYLISILYDIACLSILIAFLYGLVTPTRVYGVSGLPQAVFLRHAFFQKGLFW